MERRAAILGIASSVFAGLAARTGAAAATATLDPLLGAHEWLNGAPTAASLRGKVVLVDVFTFACINCKNVVPNLRALERERRDDFAIIGVHSPETSYEKERSSVVANLARQGITWPVAIDNSFAIWNAYGVEYWPTQLIFDRSGHLAQTVIGDSQDALVDSAVRRLLAQG
ncbi:MAG: thioredoxin-like domain-containing protein [Vulcanimicrobiaceae bacterium]